MKNIKLTPDELRTLADAVDNPAICDILIEHNKISALALVNKINSGEVKISIKQ